MANHEEMAIGVGAGELPVALRRVVSGHGLLEALCAGAGSALMFADMTRGGVFSASLDDPSSVRQDIKRRRAVGGILSHGAGGLVISGKDVIWWRGGGMPDVQLLARSEGEEFFNGMAADVRGRVYVGSVGNRLPDGSRSKGRLLRIGLTGAIEVLADGLGLSNGLAFAPSNDGLYHVDSDDRTVWIHGAEGEERLPFATTMEYEGVPDGIAVREDGSVWVALAGGGLVVAWDWRGRRICELPVPETLVTDVCFGGPDRRTMVISTGTDPESGEGDGALFFAYSKVPGLETSAAMVFASHD